MRLRLLSELFGIVKLTPPQPFPAWLNHAPIFFIARTEDEFSTICPQTFIPDTLPYSANYRCLRVDGDLAFDAIGIVARVSKPLADAGLSLFLVSTHDRDYVLVKQADLNHAIDLYQQTGFTVIMP
jgi:hypothetical protein